MDRETLVATHLVSGIVKIIGELDEGDDVRTELEEVLRTLPPSSPQDSCKCLLGGRIYTVTTQECADWGGQCVG
jgi:hypothetical protein